jgi:alpha-beta hydrolase superfamily lysophospholipase
VIRRIVIVALVWGAIFGLPECMAQNNSNNRAAFKNPAVDVRQIQKDMIALDLSAAYTPTASISSYFNYYGIGYKNVRHLFGNFTSQSRLISAHVFIPKAPKGTLFLLHGYLDHTGTFKHLIQAAVDHRFVVAVFDLPGHGLSSGERGAVEDFKAYVLTFKDFIKICAPRLVKPFHLVAHSTGCAIAFEYLQEAPEAEFDKVAFLAPLVHHAKWDLSKFGVSIAKLFVDSLPRKFRENSSDAEFLDFMRTDPLQGKRLSIKFLDALYTWNDRARLYDAVSSSVLLIQGKEDEIVDWHYNVGFLKAKINGVTLELIDDAKHQLANECKEIRDKVFDLIFDYFNRTIILWDHPDIA